MDNFDPLIDGVVIICIAGALILAAALFAKHIGIV